MRYEITLSGQWKKKKIEKSYFIRSQYIVTAK